VAGEGKEKRGSGLTIQTSERKSRRARKEREGRPQLPPKLGPKKRKEKKTSLSPMSSGEEEEY